LGQINDFILLIHGTTMKIT